MQALDPSVAPQSKLVGSYVKLGATDLAYRVMFEELNENPLVWATHWDLTLAWTDEGAAMRKDPGFGRLAERIGILDYWKQYGFPDGCRAGKDTPVVCQ
jgi:hypothetical protein